MFERFTERARQATVLAKEEARGLRHNYIGTEHLYIGTEHLLLGLLRVEDGVAAQVLVPLGLDFDRARDQVGRIVGEGDEATSGRMAFTPRAKKTLELSLREALSLGHNYIGTEHILLGLMRENEGVAARIVRDCGIDADTIRSDIQRLVPSEPPRTRRTARIFPAGWGPPINVGWEFRIELTPEGDRGERAEKLNELGAEGCQIAATLPGDEGVELILQRSLGRPLKLPPGRSMWLGARRRR